MAQVRGGANFDKRFARILFLLRRQQFKPALIGPRFLARGRTAGGVRPRQLFA